MRGKSTFPCVQTKLSELWKTIQKHAGPQFQEAVKYVQTKWKQLLAQPQVFFPWHLSTLDYVLGSAAGLCLCYISSQFHAQSVISCCPAILLFAVC